MNKSSKLGFKCYKIAQNDVPCANSIVNTINENLLFANYKSIICKPTFQVPNKTLECLFI